MMVYFQVAQLYYFCLPSQDGSTLKGKNLLLWEQILFCKSRHHFGNLPYPDKQRSIHASNITFYFWNRDRGAFNRAGAFMRINTEGKLCRTRSDAAECGSTLLHCLHKIHSYFYINDKYKYT